MVNSPEPAPDNRRRTTLRDLIGAMVVLLVIVGAVVGFGRGCTFSPGGPAVDPATAPSVDASRELAAAAAAVDFPLRRPELPGGWRANSASTAPLAAGANVVVRVGWLTPRGRFLQLSQSGGRRDDLVVTETGQPEARAIGEVDVNGVRWTVYPSRREERAWVTELDAIVLITGSADEDEFRMLAQTLQVAPPVPRG